MTAEGEHQTRLLVVAVAVVCSTLLTFGGKQAETLKLASDLFGFLFSFLYSIIEKQTSFGLPTYDYIP